MKIADFFAAIGFDVDDKALDQVDKKLESVRNNTLKVTAVLTGAVFAMDRFAASSIRSVVALTNFNMQTGLATDKLQKWQAASQLSNMAVDAQTVTSSVQSLEQSLTQIRLGQGNAAPFQLLGIDIRGQDSFSVLEQVRNRIQGLSPALATNMISQMGIDPSLLNVLRLSREEFDKLGDSLVRSKKTTDAIMRIGNAINNLKLRALKFKDDLVAKLEPAFMTVVNVLDRFGSGIVRIIDLMERFPAISAGVASALAVLFVPFKSITLVLTTLFLLLEDIAVYFQGGKSVFGMAMDGLKEGFNQFKEFLKGIGNWINDYIVVPVENAVLKLNDLMPSFEGGKIQPQNLKTGLLQGVSNALDTTSLLSGDIRPSPSMLTNNSNTNSPVINNNFTINGEQSIDIARDVVRELKEQLNYGLTDLNNGAAY